MPACGRCTKAGQAANCIYLDDAAEAPSRPSDSNVLQNNDLNRPPLEGQSAHHGSIQPGDTLARLEYQDRRIRQLEAALSQTNQTFALPPVQQLKMSKLPLTPESIAAVETAITPGNVTDRETMLLRGKSFKTQFHGNTFPGSLIAYIPELNHFTKETFERFPALARIRQDMHALEDRTEYALDKQHPTSEADMIASLPPRAETDQLVQLYLDNYDNIYHILHLPSFRQEYNEMWLDFQSARPHFVAMILLMTALYAMPYLHRALAVHRK